MFGQSVLFAPKVNQPSWEDHNNQTQIVNYYLPEDNNWYSYFTKLEEPTTGVMVTKSFVDLDWALFIRGGSIIPILQH